jgi:hypothetical protein
MNKKDNSFNSTDEFASELDSYEHVSVLYLGSEKKHDRFTPS